MTVPVPVQVFGASDTHVFCNLQGRIILANDGHHEEAALFNKYAKKIDKGVIWADRGWRSTSHHYDPLKKRGVWAWANAAERCAVYFKKALNLWSSGKQAKAMFMLGAAVHLVQDVCVPHHARCKLFSGHLDYEKWVGRNKHRYVVMAEGLYGLGETPEQWVAANALVAREYYKFVNVSNNEVNYHLTTQDLFTRAQRTTSGFLFFFYRQVMGKFLTDKPKECLLPDSVT